MPIGQQVHAGLRFPGGNPMTIMHDGQQAVNSENVWMNQRSYDMYLFRLMDMAISVFEWKNLPKGVDPRMLEFWLFRDGYLAFFYDEDLKTDEKTRAPEGYAVLPCMINGEWDMYNYPKDRMAYATNGMNIKLTEENSVLIFNDYLRIPMFDTIMLYAQRLAEIDRTIDMNVMNQKAPKIIRCDKKQRLTFKNLGMEVQGNNYWIWADESLDLKNVEVLDVSSPYVGEELQRLKHQYWNEALTYLGVENVTTEKKERLITNEIFSNMGDVEAQRFTRLNSRKMACEEINEMLEKQGWFDDPDHLPVEVEFRSGIYIKADGYGSQELATKGMQDGNVPTEPGTGYESPAEENGIIAKIREVLGL